MIKSKPMKIYYKVILEAIANDVTRIYTHEIMTAASSENITSSTIIYSQYELYTEMILPEKIKDSRVKRI